MTTRLAAAPAPRAELNRPVKDQAARESGHQRFQANLVRGSRAKPDLAAKYPRLVQRLESRLVEAWQLSRASGSARAEKSLRDSRVEMQGTNVVVIVQCEPQSKPAEVAALLAARGATVIRAGEAHVKAAVPIPALDQVAAVPGVSYVRSPILRRQKNQVVTEGLALTRANAWQAAGFTGQGVKVAVLDMDFAGLAERKASGEIPASAVEFDFSGTGMTNGTDGHGCACAEIIHDIAPDVQLYLLKTLDASDDEAAKNYCILQGVQIISFSGGYDALNFHDGVAYSSITPHPVAIANDAMTNGILWVGSAGNEQRQHALVQWRDGDANSYLDWTPGPNYDAINELWNGGQDLPAGTVIDIYLTWNAWPVTSQDFDLDLYQLTNGVWQFVTSADNLQDGTAPPFEHLNYTIDTTARYGVGIYKYSATTSPWFILRSYPYELWYFGYNNSGNPSPGSICIPADAASSFSVGTINYATYTNGPIEWFSSLGPNNGSYTSHPTVVKPDICGPDWVSTATYGTTNFGGSSASTPHIAGLAALVKSRYASYTNGQIRSWLEGHGVDLGAAGKDNTFGSGPCVMPPPDTAKPSVAITNPAGAKTYTNAQTVTLSASASDDVGVTKVEFYDGTTRRATNTVAPYNYDWTFTASNNGAHSWTARAYDAVGNVSTSSVVTLTVSIDATAPTVAISSPANGANLTTATTTVSGTAADAGSPSSGLSMVQLRLNGGSWSNVTGTASWSRSVTLVPCGNTLEARSLDKAGNYSAIASNFVTYTPPNTVPNTPTNLWPAAGARNVPITPTLQASAFHDPDPACLGDVHSASQWQVLTPGAVVVADSGTDSLNKVSWTVPAGKLYYGSNYQWQVRYRDSRNGWSSYSVRTFFTNSGPWLTGTQRGTNIVFNWPTNSAGFTLQWSTNLGTGIWSNAIPAPVIVNGQYAVTNGLTNSFRFYRLRK